MLARQTDVGLQSDRPPDASNRMGSKQTPRDAPNEANKIPLDILIVWRGKSIKEEEFSLPLIILNEILKQSKYTPGKKRQ